MRYSDHTILFNHIWPINKWQMIRLEIKSHKSVVNCRRRLHILNILLEQYFI